MPSDFKELNVWRESIDFAQDMYRLTASFPKEEIYALTSQLRRAAVSISANIAEGCGRRTSADFGNFLHMSETLCAETSGFSLQDERRVSEHAQEPLRPVWHFTGLRQSRHLALAGGS